MSDAKPLHILVVEDNEGDFFLLKESLFVSGLFIDVIHHAESLEQAKGISRINEIDLAFLDLSLPDSSGLDTFLFLNQLLPQAPIIILSGLSDMQIAIEAIALGAQDYLVKGEFDEKFLKKSVNYSIERKKNIEKLKESNERFQYVTQATSEAVWDCNLKTEELYWADNFTLLFDHLPGKHSENFQLWSRLLHPEDRDRVIIRLDSILNSEHTSWYEEYRFKKSSGEYAYITDRAIILREPNGTARRMIGAMQDLTQRKALERKLAEQQLQQQKLITEATIEAQEKERNELGKELHDNINQMLATVKMYLEICINRKGIKDELILKSYKYTSETIEEIRKLSKALVSPTLEDIGLIEALQELADDINLLNQQKIQLITESCDTGKISKDMELMVYRIVQEQLNNIQKYARATEVTISLKKKQHTQVNDQGYHLSLSIADNGVGFDTETKNKGIGLKNIRSRVEFYSGKLQIKSSPGKGCVLKIEIPVKYES